jgi:integrase
MFKRQPPKVFKHTRSPYWQYDFQIAGHRFQGSLDACGPWTECHKATAQKELERIWRDEWNLIERTKRTGREPMTFGEAADKWWQLIGSAGEERDIGPPDRPGSALHWLVQELGARKPLHRITGNDVDTLIVKRRERLARCGTDSKGKTIYRKVGARTINRTVVFLLRRIMRKAQRRWNVEIYNMPNWSDHLQKVEPHKPRVVTFAEQATLDEVERPWLRSIREFATLTGLRLRECASVRWSDLNFDSRIITVRTKGNRKQDKKVRLLPMTDPLLALLRSLKGQHPIFVFSYVAQRSFVNPQTGKQHVRGQRYPVTANYLREAVRRDWVRAGVNASFHDLRRTAARQVYDATGDIRAAQHFLGHNNVATTEGYLGVSGEHEIRASMQARDEYVARMRAEAGKVSGAKVVRVTPRKASRR